FHYFVPSYSSGDLPKISAELGVWYVPRQPCLLLWHQGRHKSEPSPEDVLASTCADHVASEDWAYVETIGRGTAESCIGSVTSLLRHPATSPSPTGTALNCIRCHV